MNKLILGNLLFASTLFAIGTESGGGLPMRPYIPAQPFAYECKLTIVDDVGAHYVWQSQASAHLDNKRTAFNLSDLTWQHGLARSMFPEARTTPTAEKPPYSLAGARFSLHFRATATEGVTQTELTASLWSASNTFSATTKGTFTDKTLNTSVHWMRNDQANFQNLNLYVDCQRTN